MQKYLLASSIISIENPKDFFGELQLEQYVIITHDTIFSLKTPNKTYTSAWLTQEELIKAVKKARKWTILDQIKLNVKRFMLPKILSKKELDDLEFSL